MAILTRTAANFRILQNTQLFPQPIEVGEAVEPGQAIYPASDGLYYLADNTDAAKVVNILFAANYGSANDFIRAIESGDFKPGATVTVGEIYAVAPTANKGEFEQFSALASSAHISILAFGKTTDTLQIYKRNLGVQKP
jgi:hypothetical protein